MTRLQVVGLVVTVVSGMAQTLGAAGGQGDERLAARSRAILEASPLIDGHNDLPWAMREQAGYDFDVFDVRRVQEKLMTDIPRLRKGMLGAQFWSVYVPSSLQGTGAVTATLEQIDNVYELLRRYPDTFAQARTADDVERIFKAGKIASLIGLEGGHSIDNSLATLRMMYRLGARYMTLTHSANVPWADAATDEPKLGGLSAFGETVVREMNYLGMLVDLSHVSPDTMADALRVSAAPVIFSHSSARALCNVPRNVPDAILAQLPKQGGVVMVTFVPGFISQQIADYNKTADAERTRLKQSVGDDKTKVDAAMQQWRAVNPEPKATVAQVVDHVDHIRKVAGIDHIGVGSDFDGITSTPVGLEDVSTYPAFVEELLRRGYSEADVKKITGGNVLRVLRAAEKVAATMQAQRAPSVSTITKVDGPR